MDFPGIKAVHNQFATIYRIIERTPPGKSMDFPGWKVL